MHVQSAKRMEDNVPASTLKEGQWIPILQQVLWNLFAEQKDSITTTTPMSFKIVSSCILLAFYALSGIASPVGTSTTEELVRTPVGLVPKSNVHMVPEGGKIIHSDTEIRLLNADGSLFHTAPLNKNARLNFPTPQNRTAHRRNLEDATVAAFAAVNSIGGFEGNWVQPPLPQVQSGQLLMYFAGIAPSNIDALIIPTLQYGVSAAGGGTFWSLVSWFISGDQVAHSNLTQLGAGTVPIDSFVVNEDEFLATPPAHAWFCGFSGFQAAGLNVQTLENFNTAVVALEITGGNDIGNLPNEPTDLNQIFILDANSNGIFPIPWQFGQDTADGITIVRPPNNLNGDETLVFEY
ncbi:hypothetical protein JR316_0009548 [Psilocybe cubensis]|uniref:Uncharacterized protein n=2 Tax=Psilocybe cubensis TaxID=181762 RepID=A0ACB8GP65_PSICU|nr:hypothetical protein JR316_0009548 [Psilocybe cubensis]KAH9477343.1 hypothetical protein JR316_0009548 [Psilocybe cubensis]